ncbi:MAG: FixH family protein [Alphaproteobacteria bacterium]|nr:FixH family protein [Alphaproteobacteria bacterium]
MALIAGAAAARACEPALSGEGVRVMRTAGHAVAWRADPQPIPLAAPFALELAACGVDLSDSGATILVDADMPAHRHGMNYRASVTTLGGGRYRAEGLLFHMPGDWRLTVELRIAGKVVRLTDHVVVE